MGYLSRRLLRGAGHQLVPGFFDAQAKGLARHCEAF
jgi:hypothetical protein